MANELEHMGVTGKDYYAKPTPIIASPWGDDAEAMTETGTTGYFSADVSAPSDAYVVYDRAGGSPADTDAVAGTITNYAIAGTTAKNLDQVVAGAGGQPRINKAAGRAFSRSVSSRADDTHKATAPVRVRAGAVGSIAVALDMRPLFGLDHVNTVGTPTVVASGAITATAAGPRDTQAMVTVGGTAVADATYVVTVPVTMDTGEQVDVDFDVEVFSD